MTAKLDERVRRHNRSGEPTTKPYAPFKLIYTEPVQDRKAARQREKYLKSGAGKEFLKELIKQQC